MIENVSFTLDGLREYMDWQQEDIGFEYRRSWKGYDFDILNELIANHPVSNALLLRQSNSGLGASASPSHL